jgi:exonuclease SbcD
VRILHTADWHVGKVLKGRSRHEEHRAVLAGLVSIARDQDVDVVLVAGDVFDTAAPTPESQKLVIQALLRLAEDDRAVLVQAGNHDNPHQLEVFRPVLSRLGIVVVGTPRAPAAGGTVELTTRRGELARVAVLPFVSQRYAVRAAEAMTNTPAQNNRGYAELVGRMMAALTEGFGRHDAVNLVMTHATLAGGRMGGGEREAQTIFDYYIEAPSFPVTTHYAALGHLHRRQEMAGPCPLHYSGSPLQVDFGETANTPVAVVVDVGRDTPARTTDVPVTGGRPLRRVTGTLDDLAELAGSGPAEEAWLQVVVREKPRAGLADDVRALLPDALEVRLDEEFARTATVRADGRTRTARTPHELFAGYVQAQGRGDAEPLQRLFGELLDEVTGRSSG